MTDVGEQFYDTTAVTRAVGARVRRWRTERSWTLDGLAERSGVSRRTLVGIEQGQSNPSIGVLLRLAKAFGVSLPSLVEESAEVSPLRVRRAGNSLSLWAGSRGGHGILVGATEPPHVVELWDWVMFPGEKHQSEPHGPGTREVLLVHEGEVNLFVGGHRARLAAGDSVVLFGDQAHAYSCGGDEKAHFSMTVLQPGPREGSQ